VADFGVAIFSPWAFAGIELKKFNADISTKVQTINHFKVFPEFHRGNVLRQHDGILQNKSSYEILLLTEPSQIFYLYPLIRIVQGTERMRQKLFVVETGVLVNVNVPSAPAMLVINGTQLAGDSLKVTSNA
jgi:hypothetical protein